MYAKVKTSSRSIRKRYEEKKKPEKPVENYDYLYIPELFI